MLTWHYVTSAEYAAADVSLKTADKLFYLSDTRQIYRGTELFTEAVSLYTTLPTTPAVGRLYIHETTLEGKIYNGSAWSTVIQPVQATVDKADTAKPVSGKAVADYVASELATSAAEAKNAFNGASYAAATNTITFTRNSGADPVAVEITDLPCDLKYDGDTGLLQLADKSGAALGTGINLDLERFVKSGEYDADTKKITLYFDDAKTDKVEIDATALVDIYTGEESTTAAVSVSSDNKITATVKVATAANNTLKVHADGGLYVAPTDLSAYATTAAVNAIKEALEASIATNASAIQAETERATAAEQTLTTNLAAEINRAKGAEEANAKAISDEADRAKGAEQTLTNNLAAEVTRATEAEGTLTTNLNAEIERAKAAEKVNADDITDIKATLEWKTSV